MRITFISDQFFPRTSADSEQIISSLSALEKHSKIRLLSASYISKKYPTKKELELYYGRECNFELSFIDHLFKNIRGLEKISFAISAAFKVRKSDCELVYTRNIPVVLSILCFTKLPILFESYRPWPSRNFLSRLLFKWLSNKKRFLGVILHSKFAKKSFIDAGFKEENLIVAHNAFDFNLYEETDRTEIREKFDLPKDKILTTYSGRVNEKKGLLRLLELAKNFPQQFFLIIGSEKEGLIEEKSAKIENIKVLKWQDRNTVFSLLKASDILYLPPTLIARDVSKNTVLPIKTFLYKASGTAIFGPDAEDIKEVLTHMENAYLVKPDDTESEYNGFEELLADKDLREKLGSNAKQDMLESTWSNRAMSILEFIKIHMNV